MRRALASLTLLAAACGGSSSPPGNTNGNGTPDAGTGNSNLTCAPEALPARGDAGTAACSGAGREVKTVKGKVTNHQAAAIAGARVQLCARIAGSCRFVCLNPATTTATGDFEITVPAEAQMISEATMRVLLPVTENATTYCPVDLAAGPADLTLTEPVRLFPTTKATAIPPEGDVNMPRTVTFADGMTMEVTPYRYFGAGDGYVALAASRIPAGTTGLCTTKRAPQFDGLYAFSPEGDVDGAGFDTKIPNATGLPACTKVGLYVLGGLDCTLNDGTKVREEEWAEYATGVVSSDGAFILATGPAAVPCLTWLGYKRK